MDLALWEMASEIRNDEASAAKLHEESPSELSRQFRLGSLPRPLQRALDTFLSKYGHRAVAEIDLGMPRWCDDPAYILGVLANYLRLEDDDAAPPAQFARGVEAAEAMIESLSAKAAKSGRLRGWFVGFALRRARQLAGIRELPKYFAIVILAAARRELLKVGEELARSGRIESADDVFFLNLTDVRAASHGRNVKTTVVERRAAYELELRRKHIPRVVV